MSTCHPVRNQLSKFEVLVYGLQQGFNCSLWNRSWKICIGYHSVSGGSLAPIWTCPYLIKILSWEVLWMLPTSEIPDALHGAGPFVWWHPDYGELVREPALLSFKCQLKRFFKNCPSLSQYLIFVYNLWSFVFMFLLTIEYVLLWWFKFIVWAIWSQYQN